MKNAKLLNAAMVGLLATAGASFVFSGSAKAADETGQCAGINGCKGQGKCGGNGTSCAGTNACKGQGWKSMTEAECKAAKGTFTASSAKTEMKPEAKKK